MDNYFSSPKLFEDLFEKSVYCCGTVRLNRKGIPPELQVKKVVKNQGDFMTMQRGKLTVTSWKDKKQVNFLATNADPTEVDVVQRRQKDGSKAAVVCPIVCKMYTNFMFGVDRADQLRVQYSTCRKAVKWWKYIFWFLFDVSVCNSYICMRESQVHAMKSKAGNILQRNQLNYRMNLAQQLIGEFRGVRKRKSATSIDMVGFSHWPVKSEKRGRCKRCFDNKRRHEVLVKCEQCQIFLCIDNDCFKQYHIELLSA